MSVCVWACVRVIVFCSLFVHFLGPACCGPFLNTDIVETKDFWCPCWDQGHNDIMITDNGLVQGLAQ